MRLFDQSNPSVMRHDFSRIPKAEIGRSRFNRPWCHKTAFNEGYLIPIMVDEVLPGDTFSLKLSAVARLTTPIVPFMDNLVMDFHFFFVPNRLVWDNFQHFMGEKTNPSDTTEYIIPTLDYQTGEIPVQAEFEEETIFDYMGLPIGEVPDGKVSALFLRAYNKIWNDWFRDQNLQDSVVENKDNGPDDIADYTLLKRGKRHDYFTSCLPWPQKGEGVELPLGTVAPVITSTSRAMTGAQERMTVAIYNSGSYPGSNYQINATQTTGYAALGESGQSVAGGGIYPANLWADLSEATASTINSLREAFQLQRMMERDARGGTRYVEILLAHFGVTSPDARLQRPEYLGGGSAGVNIHSVPQTSETNVTPTGNMAAYGYASAHGIGFTKSFVEHGMIIGLVSVRADLTYQTGLHKMWTRSTKYDFYWPALAHLGEQAVLNQEIYFQNTGDDDLVFGYQERWAEYRYAQSKITGKLRSQSATSLDIWHLSQDFASLPALDETFIQETPPVERVVAVANQPHFIFDGYFELTCVRPMPVYSVPGLIDHF